MFVSLKCYYMKRIRDGQYSVDPKHKSESATSSPNCIKKKKPTTQKPKPNKTKNKPKTKLIAVPQCMNI